MKGANTMEKKWITKKKIQEIIQKIEQAQSKAKVRLVDPQQIESALNKMAYSQFGFIQASGGKVCNNYNHFAESTSVTIKWCRNQYEESIYRGRAGSASYGESGFVRSSNSHLMSLSKNRLYKMMDYMANRKERALNRNMPKNAKYLVTSPYQVRPCGDKPWKFYYQLVVSHGGEQFHSPKRDTPYVNIQKIIDKQQKEIIRRLAEDQGRQKAKTFLALHPELVWVELEDSLKAGNCRAETMAFVEKMKAEFGDIGAIRADKLLSIRMDSYTRRACEVAAKRYAR